jgi:hypothetical protein
MANFVYKGGAGLPEPTLPDPHRGIKTGKPPVPPTGGSISSGVGIRNAFGSPAFQPNPRLENPIYGIGEGDHMLMFLGLAAVALIMLMPLLAWGLHLAWPLLEWLGSQYTLLWPPEYRR